MREDLVGPAAGSWGRRWRKAGALREGGGRSAQDFVHLLLLGWGEALDGDLGEKVVDDVVGGDLVASALKLVSRR